MSRVGFETQWFETRLLESRDRNKTEIFKTCFETYLKVSTSDQQSIIFKVFDLILVGPSFAGAVFQVAGKKAVFLILAIAAIVIAGFVVFINGIKIQKRTEVSV